MDILKKIFKGIVVLVGIVIIVPFVLMLGFFAYTIFFQDSEIGELNAQRKIVFQAIRPVFLKYKKDKSKFPLTLQALVPDYLETIPQVLLTDGTKDPVLKIRYSGTAESAEFVFRTTHGPDSRASYNIVKDEYWYDP